MRTIVSWGIYRGPLILGKYHLSSLRQSGLDSSHEAQSDQSVAASRVYQHGDHDFFYDLSLGSSSLSGTKPECSSAIAP